MTSETGPTRLGTGAGAPDAPGAPAPGATALGAGATASETGATTSLVTGATSFETAATGLGSAVTRPGSAFSAVSVPPASVLGFVAPVAGCWPDGAPEPSVLVAPVAGCWPDGAPEPSELSWVSVPPFFGFFASVVGFFAPVEGCWLVSVLFAAE